ncbi:MAG: serine hydrolase [Phycisphaerales bacterium]|nr:MAG: serine hydrolase [Phycisphaerales bacterium]
MGTLIVLAVTATVAAAVQGRAGEVWPMQKWELAVPEEVGMNSATLVKARDYALTGDGSGCIVRHGKLVMRWGDQARRYDLKSSTKAIGITAVGLALKDGRIKSLGDAAKQYHPGFGVPPESNAQTGWLDKITLFHLATQTAGFDKSGGYMELLFEPGTKWCYSDGGPNWLAECVTLVYGRDLNEVMFERVFGPIGIEPSDLTWRKNAYRPERISGIKRREFGSGISANVDAMARIGYLYLRRGRWQDNQIIPEEFVDMARTVPEAVGGLPVVREESYFNASDHYGLLWWNNADGTMKNVPRDACFSWGLYDSLIVVIPSVDIVAARAGESLNKVRNSDYGAIEPFIEPIALSVEKRLERLGYRRGPYPPSPVIRGVEWAPADTIVRKAQGSDNWPITWADDDNLYTAYGDGWGFEPKTDKKLSLGLAKVIGLPPDLTGVNIRTETGERVGQGVKGAKASGMLCVDGVLYMLVRNVGNSQVVWSADHGQSWTWCDWRFGTSFGAPTFLNFDKNYAGARDEFVYMYSHDSDSAYEPADRMVLARVPKDKVSEREAYSFFQGLDGSGQPGWTKDIDSRGAVFANPGRCYRNGISYNAGLDRYLWCQTLHGKDDMRFTGGLGIFDAPEPWGPWTTVFYTEKWDVGPGETNSFPTKWISNDGKTCCLLFSGDDCFSVREATFR